MRNILKELAAVATVMSATTNAPMDYTPPVIYPGRGHKATVKRRKLRRIKSESRRANRK